MHPRHDTELSTNHSSYYDDLKATGNVELLTGVSTGDQQAISAARLAALSDWYLPVQVTGDDIQYQVNRNDDGWVIELVHNDGVEKTPTTAQDIDANDVADVDIKARFTVDSANEWGIDANGVADDEALSVTNNTVSVTVGPGESVFVELVLP